ncbi:MAG: hypothetical protein GY787_26325, partial [Alteromonadales bacterium]|nr:hypothetical protein [Alteromonadales bacterium]
MNKDIGFSGWILFGIFLFVLAVARNVFHLEGLSILVASGTIVFLIDQAKVHCDSKVAQKARLEQDRHQLLLEQEIEEEVKDSILNLCEDINGTNSDSFSILSSIEKDGKYVELDNECTTEFNVYYSLSNAVSLIVADDFKKKYITQLKRDYKRLVVTDEYGISNSKKWDKKLNDISSSILIENYNNKLQESFNNLHSMCGLEVGEYGTEEDTIESLAK